MTQTNRLTLKKLKENSISPEDHASRAWSFFILPFSIEEQNSSECIFLFSLTNFFFLVLKMNWDFSRSKELYSIDKWGNGYFDINEAGEVIVNLKDGDKNVPVSIAQIVKDQADRGRPVPLLIRFRDLLDSRIEALNESFLKAFKKLNYQGAYRGVYPIKVNQQQQVIEEICDFGKKYHYGLEAGSKPELLVALAHLKDKEALLICNGYKDDEFIDLALKASKTGMKVILVVEMPSEVDAIIERSKALGIRPTLGIRFRLSAKSEGHWAESGGDRSTFGLNTAQLIDAVDRLQEKDFLDCLELFHYHQGSQLPNIRAIREAATEAVKVYVNLVKEGAPMGILDMGGGLAVDYDGTQTNFISSCNYGLEEYAADLVEIVKEACDKEYVQHPTIVTESGRAVVAHYSVLTFNILDVTQFEEHNLPPTPSAECHEMMHNLWEVKERISEKNLQECFNDTMFYRDQIRSLFNLGLVSLRERALGEKIYWYTITLIAKELKTLEEVPEDLLSLESNLISYYYGNFSVFQSLPDHWAIDQLFPIMPLQRLNEEPSEKAILADITCDCDGKVDRFIDVKGAKRHLPVHQRTSKEDYLIGAFLVGAYQETLGDLHNLLGDPHVVSVDVKDGEIIYTQEVDGDSVADVLSYVEYDPKVIEKQFRETAEKAVQSGSISAKERRDLMETFRETLNGYTYYEN